MIRVAGMNKQSVVDGSGVRLVVYLQGCPHRCYMCHNESTWDKDGGELISVETLAHRIKKDLTVLHSGITFSGGEPLLQHEPLLRLIKMLPKTNIWLYTGYEYDEVKDLPIMGYIDVLVDGKFIFEKKSLKLKFRGSSNQKIIELRDKDEDR